MSKQKETNRITIIIADDHPLILEGISSMLSSHTNYKIIAKAKNGKALLHKLNSVQPDIVMLDLNMPQISGSQAANEIKEKYPQIKIIFISAYWDIAFTQTIKTTGAHGFIPKLVDPEVFINALKKIVAGKKVFIKTIAEQTPDTALKDHFKDKSKLTKRERELILLIKKGLSTKEISEKIFLSTHTVNTHRKNICKKLGIKNPNGLVKYVYENF